MEENKKLEKNNKTLNENIRQIIVSASIGLAVISSYTTAKGLAEYVFKDVFWQAMVVSVAIQGGLFVLNLNLVRYIKKSLLILLLWLILLLISSSFSYVYISEKVYPNELYREDANRILTEESIECCEILKTYITKYSSTLIESIESFIFIIEIEEESSIPKKELQFLETIVEEINISEAKEIDILDFIEQINKKLETLRQQIFPSESDNMLEGDGETIEKDIPIKVEKIITELQSSKIVLEAIKQNIEESKKLEIDKLEAERERLKDGFFDTSLPVYSELNDINKKREERITLMQILLNKVELKIQDIDKMILEFETKNSYMSNVAVQGIKKELIKAEPDLENIQKYMDSLSVIILQEKNQDIISSYRNFIESVEAYKEMLKREKEISELYNELTKVLSSEEMTREKLRTKWSDVLKKIRILFIEIPIESQEEFFVENNIMIENALRFENIRKEKLEFLSEIERRYFSEMNNLERAWILLTNHKYRNMAIYSGIFSLFLDTIGTLMGIFLHVLEKEDGKDSRLKRVLEFIFILLLIFILYQLIF